MQYWNSMDQLFCILAFFLSPKIETKPVRYFWSHSSTHQIYGQFELWCVIQYKNTLINITGYPSCKRENLLWSQVMRTFSLIAKGETILQEAEQGILWFFLTTPWWPRGELIWLHWLLFFRCASPWKLLGQQVKSANPGGLKPVRVPTSTQ